MHLICVLYMRNVISGKLLLSHFSHAPLIAAAEQSLSASLPVKSSSAPFRPHTSSPTSTYMRNLAR
jgi:hypothetical protein